MALTRSTDPLVWIDCEMTGLDPTTDTILSISCIITTHDLDPLDREGYHATISTPQATLDAMSAWCQQTHGSTGLTAACLSSTTTASTAAASLLSYIQRHVPGPRTALLAGNSVHVDKLFLMRAPWTPVVEWLHYRILDVSAVKEAVRRWCPDDVIRLVPPKKMLHEAEADVWESIEEARFYMGLLKGVGGCVGWQCGCVCLGWGGVRRSA